MGAAQETTTRIGLVVHLFVAFWILVSGVAHQAQVVYRAARGTLGHPADLDALLLVGAGLIVAGGAMTAAGGPLWRRDEVSWALLSVAVLVAVLAGTYARFGPRFLVGSTVLATIDLLALALHAWRSARAA